MKAELPVGTRIRVLNRVSIRATNAVFPAGSTATYKGRDEHGTPILRFDGYHQDLHVGRIRYEVAR